VVQAKIRGIKKRIYSRWIERAIQAKVRDFQNKEK